MLADRIGLDPAAVGSTLIPRAVKLRMMELGLDDAGDYVSLLAGSRDRAPGSDRRGRDSGELVFSRRASIPTASRNMSARAGSPTLRGRRCGSSASLARRARNPTRS